MRAPTCILSGLAAIWLLASCNETSVAGGSGAEAGNGLKVAALGLDGAPVAGARVEVRASRSESAAPLMVDSTGFDGIAHLLVKQGDWAILVRKGDLAFWKSSNGTELVSDTLRPTVRLSGIVEGGQGLEISALGLGDATRCDAEGYFQLENLPSGQIPLGIHALGNLVSSTLDLEPGSRSIALTSIDSIPPYLPSLVSDSLIAWSHDLLPAALPLQALGDSGKFSVAVRLHRQDLATPVWALSWTGEGRRGIRVGWRGADSFIVELDGKRDTIVGIPLDTGSQQVGLSWDGHRIVILHGSDSVYAKTNSNFDRRATWTPPQFGLEGISRVVWVAFKRGLLLEDWLQKLSRM